MKRKTDKSLSKQLKDKANKAPLSVPELDGNIETMIDTGSTLLNLAISGGRIRGGGLPGGILVEISGAESTAKTVLLCEIAGSVQRQGGEVMFLDPEARLNKQFAKLFDLDVSAMNYSSPDTIPEAFKPIREWEPKPENKIHIICTDSLAALSTEMEMESEDKRGQQRAKEFSEHTRKTCRILQKRNLLMCCSNQLRDNSDGNPYTPKDITPGGRAIPFYSSLRIRCKLIKKIKKELLVAGKKIKRITGVRISAEVFKNTVWKPYYQAELTLMFDYGIDNIRENLQYIKTYTTKTVYSVEGDNLGKEIGAAIQLVEEHGLEAELENQVIDLWFEIESQFKQERKPKAR